MFKIQEKIIKMDQKNFNLLLVVGGPWEGLGTETPLPNIHSLAQSMANRLHLMKKEKRNTYNSGMGLLPSPPLYNTSAYCEP
jgi:hypothetical protein